MVWSRQPGRQMSVSAGSGLLPCAKSIHHAHESWSSMGHSEVCGVLFSWSLSPVYLRFPSACSLSTELFHASATTQKLSLHSPTWKSILNYWAVRCSNYSSSNNISIKIISVFIYILERIWTVTVRSKPSVEKDVFFSNTKSVCLRHIFHLALPLPFPTKPPSISASPLPSRPSAYYCSPQSHDQVPTTNSEKTSPQPPNSSNPTHSPH